MHRAGSRASTCSSCDAPDALPGCASLGCRVTLDKDNLVRPVVMGSRQEGSRLQVVRIRSCKAVRRSMPGRVAAVMGSAAAVPAQEQVTGRKGLNPA